ncbi:rIIB protector from prophage-induced early lysis [Acinetobacter phage Ac42]|uniref:RIIB lysis inhibitor n=1 Tax=Acinetobacter phage Ac42 TaxID=762660 RepID=UPI0001EBCE36|nr:RIIB lysis inhibitor [Acinetobacter phage Ac42]ADI96493.1 rIIB protector from prophage-induced early lysis [Acinetobacter phage Ac42]
MKKSIINCLDLEEQRSIVIQYLSKLSKAAIARNFDVSSDTVTRVLKNNAEILELFEEVDGSLVITNPRFPIHILGDFICPRDIEITGDPKDGLIICDDVFLTEESQYSATEALEYCFEEHDLGTTNKIRVGAILYISDDPRVETLTSLKKVKHVLPRELPHLNEVVVEGSVYVLDSFEDDDKFVIRYFDERVAVTKRSPKSTDRNLVWSANSTFISITEGREAYQADKSHPNFKAALLALAEDRVSDALDLINIKRAIERYTSKSGNVYIEGSRIFYKEIEIENSLVKRIIADMEAQKEFEFYIPFLENMMENPSRKVVTRIFDFLEANDIEITESGHFIAFKKVDKNYRDIHSGRFDNSPGVTVTMPRNQVDEDDNRTCSEGLHVCSKSYLSNFATAPKNRVVTCLVNPRDVVSIPVDYNNAKMRTCEYVVLEDVTDTV